MIALDSTQVSTMENLHVEYVRMPDELIYFIEQLDIEKGVVGFKINLEDFSPDNKSLGVVVHA